MALWRHQSQEAYAFTVQKRSVLLKLSRYYWAIDDLRSAVARGKITVNQLTTIGGANRCGSRLFTNG
jgi:hypothetical protein